MIDNSRWLTVSSPISLCLVAQDKREQAVAANRKMEDFEAQLVAEALAAAQANAMQVRLPHNQCSSEHELPRSPIFHRFCVLFC